MDDSFDAKALALMPEHLENLRRLAETGIAATKRERRKREFAQITREQLNVSQRRRALPTAKVFHFLLLIDWRSPGKPILLANADLEQTRRLPIRKAPRPVRIEEAGLIEWSKRRRKSPESHHPVICCASAHGAVAPAPMVCCVSATVCCASAHTIANLSHLVSLSL